MSSSRPDVGYCRIRSSISSWSTWFTIGQCDVAVLLLLLLACASGHEKETSQSLVNNDPIRVNDGKTETSDEISHGRSHRDANYYEDEMCLANYDISEGSIIRVHDSQKLGAKYLNETDLGQGIKSREECLKLCCRTPRCNVNVFEEKNTGSCYLFDCGPPEDFRCKFTTQQHYTIGVLRKRNFQLPSSSYQLNQHETELNQLRSLEGSDGIKSGFGLADRFLNIPSGANPIQQQGQKQQETTFNFQQPLQQEHQQRQQSYEQEINPKPLAIATTTAPSTTTIAPEHNKKPQQQSLLIDSAANVQHLQQAHQQMVQPVTQQLKPPPPQDPQPLQQRSACSRNQFECKSSGECIAIYNACDGIPQCSDGSDEGFELHCPSEVSNPGFVPAVRPGVVQPSEANMLSTSRTGGGQPNSGGASGAIGFNHQSQSGSVPASRPGVSQQEEYKYPLPPSVSQFSLPQQSSPSSGASSPSMGNSRLAGNMKPDPLSNFQPQPQQTPSQGLNIFSHKDGGIMDDTYANQNQPQRHTTYWKQPNPLDYSTADAPQTNGNAFNPPAFQLPGSSNYGANGNLNYGAGYGLPGYNYPQSPGGQNPQQGQQYPLPYGQYGSVNGGGSYPPVQQQPQQQIPYYQQPQYNPVDNSGYRPVNSGAAATYGTVVTNDGALKIAVSAVNSTVSSAALPTPKVSSGSVTTSTGTKIGISYQEISKLELPENLKSLSAQIKSFAAESENDLSTHTAGAGAILAFIMGLLMSVVMALIVGCRLRRIGNRRRGKNRLDPDYLVDGMYL